MPSDNHLFFPMKESLRGKHNASDEEMKSQTTFQSILQSRHTGSHSKGVTLLLRETVTMLRSREVIHRGPALF